MTATELRRWRFHPLRDQLLAEVHARPSTSLSPPMLATRIATLSGENGAAVDCQHMVTLCRRLGQSEPSAESKWCVLDAGSWKLRWERHTEFSTWTFFRTPTRSDPFLETGLDLAPVDWLDSLPGEVLVATNLALVASEKNPPAAFIEGVDTIGATILNGKACVYTDLRPDANGMTRFLLVAGDTDDDLIGRIVLRLLEVETYRLMALLAFPLAGDISRQLIRIEAHASELAAEIAQDGNTDQDRRLLSDLAKLAGETEALIAQSSFRFGAGAAYHEIVRDRIDSLDEEPIDGLQTLGSFMERRLAPAMRTCETVSRRAQIAIERIARTEDMLNTRVEVAAEESSAALLASMDRRADMQLRLQRAVEGFSVIAISYYLLGIFLYVFKAVEHLNPRFDPVLAGGIIAPFIVAAVWLILRRFYGHYDTD
jgi:uncharacterized membrane-anchored protein